MNKTCSLNIRIEPQLKKDVENTLDNLGMTIAEAVTVFLKQVVLTDSIPFIIKNPHFSSDLEEALKEAEEIEKHPEKNKKYSNVEDLMEDLHNEIRDYKD